MCIEVDALEPLSLPNILISNSELFLFKKANKSIVKAIEEIIILPRAFFLFSKMKMMTKEITKPRNAALPKVKRVAIKDRDRGTTRSLILYVLLTIPESERLKMTTEKKPKHMVFGINPFTRRPEDIYALVLAP